MVSLQSREETDEEGRPFVPYEPLLKQLAAAGGTVVSCTRHPIADCGAPRPAEMVAILDAIDASIADARPVYVHCWGGHGRTATVVGCWLVRHGCSGTDALAAVTALRRHDHYLREQPAPQTDQQRQLVRDWAEWDAIIGGRSGRPSTRREHGGAY
ncbi:MAG TPA: protein phosphatase [Phycisphaerae bacterium]|nr:protein phosphatase [Phycisphaerae bacterium]HNU46895.1 protein phosphatase [Phycisphaerae bacterium]